MAKGKSRIYTEKRDNRKKKQEQKRQKENTQVFAESNSEPSKTSMKKTKTRKLK